MLVPGIAKIGTGMLVSLLLRVVMTIMTLHRLLNAECEANRAERVKQVLVRSEKGTKIY